MNNKIKIILISLFIFVFLINMSNALAAEEVQMKKIDYSGQKNLKISAGGTKIIFKENSDEIHITEGLKFIKSTNYIHINSPKKEDSFKFWPEKEEKIIIGSKLFNDIEINVGGANISGIINTRYISINGGGINITADIISDIIQINGGGVNLKSKIIAESIAMNGAGMKIDLLVKKTKTISLDGAGMSAQIKYLDFWDDNRDLSVNGIGGNLKIYVLKDKSKDFSGDLNVIKNGLMKVEIEHYKN